MRARALALLPAVCLLSLCAPRKGGIEVLSFRDADPAVLGEQTVLHELGISFRAPRNWRMEPDAGLEKISIGSFKLEPARIFYRDDGMGFCLVSRLVPPDGARDDDLLYSYAKDLLGKRKSGDAVFYKDLRINRLPGILLRITEKDTVLYKFIVASGDSLFQLDFAFPISEFNDSVLARMKASVSTIRASP